MGYRLHKGQLPPKCHVYIKNFWKASREATKNLRNYDSFDNTYLSILNKHAPIKQKTLRANEAPFMTKTLRKAMMKRTQLATKFKKSNLDADYTNLKKHRNFVNRLYKRERKS